MHWSGLSSRTWPPYYQISDLVICRSGASTVAELAVCGKAALLIPYPYAAHQHQLINAKKLVDLGAARMILDQELNGQSMAQAILHLYDHPEERVRMEEAIRQVGPDQGQRKRSWIIVMPWLEKKNIVH